jgi:hypothetical protein
MAAIVLGLLVASAKGSYDTKHDQLQSAAAKFILLDRTLRQYGPETQPVRALLLGRVKSLAGMGWVKKEQASSDARTAPPAIYGYEQMWLAVRTLSPRERRPARSAGASIGYPRSTWANALASHRTVE